jgi:hypothetical protein
MKELAKRIEAEMKLLTTSQKLHNLRKSHNDSDILEALEYCSIGIRSSLSSLISKEVSSTRYSAEEREQQDDYSND